jgi:hypothetical protein
MKCPIDSTDLMMTTREGIEIDYCPKCRGIWLDRGELEKLIERSARYEAQAAPRPSAPEPPVAPAPRQSDPYRQPPTPEYDNRRRYDDDDDDRRYRDDDRYYSDGKKKKSFLGDLFDIF